MNLLGIIGFPLTHSFSKQYFTEKFQRESIDGYIFDAFELKSITEITTLVSQTPSMKGFAVTKPYKQQIVSYLDFATPDVQVIGACNCVNIVEGKLYGYNTDVLGFEESLKPNLQPHHNKALVLGTGGAAQAVAYVFRKLEIDFLFVTRNELQKENHINYTNLNQQIIEENTLIINASPVGTFPNIEDAPAIPYQFISDQHYCFDLVYNPPQTKFLALSEKQKAITKNGFDMLAIQAEANWEIWNS
jgi:shikimate dehydrogenase